MFEYDWKTCSLLCTNTKTCDDKLIALHLPYKIEGINSSSYRKLSETCSRKFSTNRRIKICVATLLPIMRT